MVLHGGIMEELAILDKLFRFPHLVILHIEKCNYVSTSSSPSTKFNEEFV